ncbi:MAG: hypothetical protein NC400_11710 [Clostridium sp.]|nr:hypothetical protein [Clostridium sp.]
MAVGGLDTAQMMQEIRGKREELYRKIVKGETEQKFQIGAEAYTVKEWKRLLDRFDETQEDVKEALEEEKERRGETQKKSAVKKTEEESVSPAENLFRKMQGLPI